jgi:hypothetical protein
MSGQNDELDQLPLADLGHHLGVLRVRESLRSQHRPSDLDEQSIGSGQPVEGPVRPHCSDCLSGGSLLVCAVLASCPGIARLHVPRRDQDHQLAVSRRQVAVEAEVVGARRGWPGAARLPAGRSGRASTIRLRADAPPRALVVSGKSIHESVVAYGPFGMNTEEEIVQAYRDSRTGKFGVPTPAALAKARDG